jgi:hypothetical protein
LTDRPALAPAARKSFASFTGSRAASACTVTLWEPASAYPIAHRSGLSIMRWQSIGRSVYFIRLCTTGRPNVRLGTKCPSITSTCSQSAPGTALASSASRAKSADSRDGAIIGWCATGCTVAPREWQTVL